MYKFIYLSIILIIGLVKGHTQISRVNDETVGLRSVSSNSPVKDVNSPDMVCGVGAQQSSGPLRIKAGDTLKLTYVHSENQAIDPSHQGPCIAYIAEASNPTKFSKFFEDGYDADGKSCITRRLVTRRSLTLKLPQVLKSGNYTVRSELIALHQADGLPPDRGAEFYIQCIDINVRGGSGEVGVGDTAVTIPGYLTQNSPGVRFNVYGGKVTNYPIPGPPIDPAFTLASPPINTTKPDKQSPPASNNDNRTSQPTPTTTPNQGEVIQPDSNPNNRNAPQNEVVVPPPPTKNNVELAKPPPPAINVNPESTPQNKNPSSSERLVLLNGFVMKSRAECHINIVHHAFANFVFVILFILFYD